MYETHVSRDVFRHLVNTVYPSRIIEFAPGYRLVSDCIRFIYEQCRLFAGNVTHLIDKTDLGRRRMLD